MDGIAYRSVSQEHDSQLTITYGSHSSTFIFSLCLLYKANFKFKKYHYCVEHFIQPILQILNCKSFKVYRPTDNKVPSGKIKRDCKQN